MHLTNEEQTIERDVQRAWHGVPFRAVIAQLEVPYREQMRGHPQERHAPKRREAEAMLSAPADRPAHVNEPEV